MGGTSALVNVDAGLACAGETGVASALERTRDVRTSCLAAAIVQIPGTFVHISAVQSVAGIACGARAGIGPRRVSALGVGAASVEVWLQALVDVGAAHSVHTGEASVAGASEGADGVGAGCRGGAGIGTASSALVNVAAAVGRGGHEAHGTGADKGDVRVRADGDALAIVGGEGTLVQNGAIAAIADIT